MHNFDKVLINMNFVIKTGLITLALLLIAAEIFSQPPNYSAWHFRDGNFQGTKRGGSGFYQQDIDSFIVKWATPYISGDVTPLIGNIVNNEFPGISEAQPLEMAALMGDEMIILSGAGTLLKKQKLPVYAQNVKAFTMLFDSLNTGYSNFSNNTVLIASESIEFINPNVKDKLAHSYIFGYDAELDSIKVVRRLSIDLKEYGENLSASIKPFYGRRVNGRMMVYAVVDMNMPIIPKDYDATDISKLPPFFRGFAQFYDDNAGALFPLPDIRDQAAARIHFSSDVGLYQPSIQPLANNLAGVLLPWQAANITDNPKYDSLIINSNVAGTNYSTQADEDYIIGFNITNIGTSSNFEPQDLLLSTDSSSRPIIRPVYAELNNGSSTVNYIIVAEQYSGIDSSKGQSRLHLYDIGGNPITDTSRSDTTIIPPLIGGMNHYWSVAVGNVDGNSQNSWSKYFPNNPGNEIIVTQSSKESVHPESRLFVMRYKTDAAVEKPIPVGDFLYPFDTIATSRVNGWVAAVADIDLNLNGKDEIILVDGSKLIVLSMRDYEDMNFRLGYPFDTLIVKEFRKQTISNVAIADMEGDGRPDIIVTTFDSTYVIGSVISNSMTVNCPEKNGLSEFCINDTINLTWNNTIMSQPTVSIRFERLNNDGTVKDTLLIKEFADNNGKTIYHPVIGNSEFFKDISSKIISGRFLINGTDYPEAVRAESCIITINKPVLTVTSITPLTMELGDLLQITGLVSCVDSVEVSYKLSSDSIWTSIRNADMTGADIFFSTNISCFDTLFNCSQSISDLKYINFMLIAFTNGLRDTTYINPINITPKRFNITIDDKLTADPTLVIRWQPAELIGLMNCNMVSVSVSLDGGDVFNELEQVNVNDALYKWKVPYNIQDSIIVRLCCPNSACYRAETSVTGVTPKYVNIIAPNPFNPNREIMEFVYKVPENLNVTVSIYDQSNRIVKRILNSQPRIADIVYTDYWDGTKDNGEYAANGLYYLIMDLSNGKREIHHVYVGK